MPAQVTATPIPAAHAMARPGLRAKAQGGGGRPDQQGRAEDGADGQGGKGNRQGEGGHVGQPTATSTRPWAWNTSTWRPYKPLSTSLRTTSSVRPLAARPPAR